MMNPFVNHNRANPYLWNPFTVCRIRRDEWRDSHIGAQIRTERTRTGSNQQRKIEGVAVTEEAVTALCVVFEDVNARLRHELLLHPEHSSISMEGSDVSDRLRSMRPACTPASKPTLRVNARKLVRLTTWTPPRLTETLSMAPKASARSGVRIGGSLHYVRQELL